MFNRIIKSLIVLTGAALLVCACGPAPAPTTEVPPTDTPAPLPSATLEKTMNAHWVFETEAAVWGSASLNGDTVFIGSDDGNLYALEAQSGSLLWKFASQGIVRSTPAVAGDLVYFSSDDGFLYAVRADDGTKAWSTDIGNFYDRAAREGFNMSSVDPTGYDYVQSSPVVADGTVYVGSTDKNLYALDANTGAVKWTFATSNKIRATPVVDQGTVYFGSWDELMYAVDVATGKARWAVGVGGEVQSKAVVANGMVYTASRRASVVALDAQTGGLNWEYSYGSNLWVESSPNLVNGVIYIGSSGSKIVLGLDALTGKPTSIYTSKDFHWSTPLIIGDRLYIGGTSPAPDASGGLYSLSMTNGTFFNATTDLQVFSTPTTREYANVWIGIAGSPVTENGLIYFGALDGKVYAVNAIP